MSGSSEVIEVRVLNRRQQGGGIISLDLAAPEGIALPPFEAGSHIDLHVGTGLVRQYSLWGDPAETNRYRLGVLLEEGGRGGSAAVHRELLEGHTVQISVPRNTFKLVEDATHYCTRSHGWTAFTDEIAKSGFASQVHMHHDDDPATQRFDPARDLPAPGPGVHLYVCGPKGFMDWVIGAAKAQGWSSANVHCEHFSAKVSITGDAFTVEARRSGKTVTVSSGQSIAAALLDAGIAIPLSCEQGVCGACMVNVIEGTPDHRDMLQTDEEKALNQQITPCCSRSLSPKLILDI